MGRLDDMADRVELRDLVDRYALAADTRDRDGFVGAFTADGVLSVGSTELRGAKRLADPLAYLDLHYVRTMHFTGNHIVDLDGDSAEGIVYGLAHHLTKDGTELRDTAMAVRYTDTYSRTDAGWRIAHRKVDVDWEEDRAAVPVRGPLSDI